MGLGKPSLAALFAAALLAVSCASSGPPGARSTQSSGGEAQRTGTVRITAAILATPTNLFRPLMAPGYLGQTGDVCDLILVGLSNADNQDKRNAVFAEAI